MSKRPVMAEVDRTLAGLLQALVDGDIERFRAELYDPGTNRVKHDIGVNLLYGFKPPRGVGAGSRMSFGQICLKCGERIEMLREAVAAEPPHALRALAEGNRRQWYRHLCTRMSQGKIESVSVGGGAACWGHRLEFVELHLEMDPECPGLERAARTVPSAAARINEARMALCIRQAAAQRPVFNEPTHAPAARRARTL